MDGLIIENFSKEVDVFDKSIYPFYQKQNISIYRAVQKCSLKKLSNTIMKTIEINGVVKNNNSQETKKVVNVMAANIDEYTQKMIDSGEWLLQVSKTKQGFNPTLVDNKSKQYVTQLTLENKEISLELNNKKNNLDASLAELYLQQQMSEIMDQLEIINNTIQRVERGQLDDRIGIFLSAKQQFIEAMSVENETLQQLTLVNAIKDANKARFQLMQSAISNISCITQPTKKKMKVNEVDMVLDNIRESVAYINEATLLCLSAYSLQKENKAQIAVLNSYQAFIEKAFFTKVDEKYTNAQILHTNWGGSDSSWLEFPKKIDNMISTAVQERKKYLQNG